MIETEKKEIDGVVYKVQQMDAIRGLVVEAKLIKLLGPAIGKTLITGKADKKALKDQAIGHLIENFDDKFVVDFVISLFDKGVFFVDKDGEDCMVIFKTHFTGKPMTVWKVLWFILTVNFGGLMGKLEGGLNHLKKNA